MDSRRVGGSGSSGSGARVAPVFTHSGHLTDTLVQALPRSCGDPQQSPNLQRGYHGAGALRQRGVGAALQVR
jgi:hypothetical protein